MRRAKHLFVTGGVVSSLGKGITAASLGMLLERRGFRVRLQKIDPYLNVDPGTMSPHQHGEVYVLDDGTETDLDLGHYERFCAGRLDRRSSFTMGRIYATVLEGERRGDYLGQTVQTIPHVTDAIKSAILALADGDADLVITEVGGTVGDIEAQPVLEAIRQLAHERGRDDVAFLHLVLVPYLEAAGEAKTKPTQHSVGQLRQVGIQPDFLACRVERPMLADADLAKIALFSDVPRGCVVEVPDGRSIYDVPGMLAARGLDALVCSRLGLTDGLPLDLSDWRETVAAYDAAAPGGGRADVALVGKYVGHKDAYKSIEEALRHAAARLGLTLRIHRIDADAPPEDAAWGGHDGVLVPGGFGVRGFAGKMDACRSARERSIPFLGICLGLQAAVVEFARNVLRLEGAHSTEFDPDTPHPVVGLLDGQTAAGRAVGKGGTMRLGGYPMRPRPGSRLALAYDSPGDVRERHRHRYEVADAYRSRLEAAGLVVSGASPDGTLVEAVELRDHPWYVAVQFHPEFESGPTAPHPLFLGFLGAAAALRRAKDARECRRQDELFSSL